MLFGNTTFNGKEKFKVLGLINNIEEYQKIYNHVWKKTWIKNWDLIKEINQNELMIKKCKKVCRVLNYIDYLLILTSTITGCVSSSAFASSVGISIGIRRFLVGLKTLQ